MPIHLNAVDYVYVFTLSRSRNQTVQLLSHIKLARQNYKGMLCRCLKLASYHYFHYHQLSCSWGMQFRCQLAKNICQVTKPGNHIVMGSNLPIEQDKIYHITQFSDNR